jgi:hypothetical protein
MISTINDTCFDTYNNNSNDNYLGPRILYANSTTQEPTTKFANAEFLTVWVDVPNVGMLYLCLFICETILYFHLFIHLLIMFQMLPRAPSATEGVTI